MSIMISTGLKIKIISESTMRTYLIFKSKPCDVSLGHLLGAGDYVCSAGLKKISQARISKITLLSMHVNETVVIKFW